MARYNGQKVVFGAQVSTAPIEITQETGNSQTAVMSQAGVTSNFMSALKKTISGNVVSVDDVSPLQHFVKVRVRGSADDITNVTVTRYGANESDNKQAYTPDADGIVHGVLSLAPAMTLTTDNENVVLEVEYCRDSEQVFARKTQEYLFVDSIEECTKTNRLYVLPDGYIYAYTPNNGRPLFTNLADPSKTSETPNTALSADEWLNDYRIANKAIKEAPLSIVTNKIPLTYDDVVRIKGFDVSAKAYNSATACVQFRVLFCDENGNVTYTEIKPAASQATEGTTGKREQMDASELENGIYSFPVSSVIPKHSIAYARVCGYPVEGEEIIITVNEPIEYVPEYSWSNTGLVYAVDEEGEEVEAISQVTPKSIKETITLDDTDAEILDGYAIEGHNTTTLELSINKYLTAEKIFSYKIDLKQFAHAKLYTKQPYMKTISGYRIIQLADENMLHVRTATGNYTTNPPYPTDIDIQLLGLTTSENGWTLDLELALEKNPKARYLIITMEKSRKLDWYVSGVAKTIDWLGLASAKEMELIFPKKMYASVGNELNLYHENFTICNNPANYAFWWSVGNLTNCEYYDDRLRITPTTAGEYSVRLTVLNKVNLLTIAEAKFTLVVSDSTVTDEKKVMYIGDSLTDASSYPYEVQANLSGGKFVSIGTRHRTISFNGGAASVDIEGRSGWASYDYVNYNGKYANRIPNNPFWNPTTEKFDFAYYMSNNGFDTVDAVCINLGTNGYRSSACIPSIIEMVNNIRAYSATVPILVHLLPPLAKIHIEPYNYPYSNYELKQYVKTLIELFEDNEEYPNVYLPAVYASIDKEHDFKTAEVPISSRNEQTMVRITDNYHPAFSGYMKMADVYFNTLLAVFKSN